jgi:tetratricopeptide (TPR) repeat protein
MACALADRGPFLEFERPVAAEICRLVDGIPLAIELAAARIETLGLAALRDQLAASSGVLSRGRRDAPERHLALDATIAWSRTLLSADAAEIMDCLGAMAAGGTLEQLSSFTGVDHNRTLAAVTELVDQRLVHARDGAGGARFFVMLRVIREAVWAGVVREGYAPRFQRQIAAHYRALTRGTDGATSRASERRDVFLRYDDELETIRSILGWAEEGGDLLDDGAVLAANMTTFWWSQHLLEGIGWLERLHIAARRIGHPADARLLVRAAFLSTYGGSSDQAIVLAERAVQIGRRRDPHSPDVSLGLQVLGAAWSARGESQRALDAVREGLEIDSSLSEKVRAVHVVNHANVLLSENLVDKAEALYLESVAYFRRVSERWLVAGPLGRLADVALRRGDTDQAIGLLEEARQSWATGPGSTGKARTEAGLARAYLLAGKEDLADTMARAAFQWAHECGAWGEICWAIAVHAAIQVDRGRADDAACSLEATLLLARAFAQPIHGCLRHELGPWCAPLMMAIDSAGGRTSTGTTKTTDGLLAELEAQW